MANSKSQEKRNRQNLVRQERNKAARSEMKTNIKRAIDAAEAGDENAGEALVLAQKSIDQAASTGILKPNTAARRKSQLMKSVNAANAS